MIKWYTIKDIMAGYALTKWQLLTMIRDGLIGAMKMRDKRWKKGSYQYFIPEAELTKLSAYKTGEPLFKAEHQPSEYLTPKKLSIEMEILNDFAGDYREYLNSDHWKRVREQAFKRDGNRCYMCGTGKNLEVHHRRYDSLGTENEIDDVITVCDDYHTKIHEKDMGTNEQMPNN